jgi:hypothetical protein
MVVSLNIPLHKVEAASFQKFLEKYTTLPIPTESTMRRNYLASCYEDTINKIRNSVREKTKYGSPQMKPATLMVDLLQMLL